MHRILLLIASLCVVLAACVHTVPAGQTLTLTGKVVVNGSALFQQPVLLTAGGEAWQLEALPAEQARALDGRAVTVTGVVLRASQPGTWAPALRVERVERVEDAAPARP
ncbi:DUF5818 domain-containing protein [Cupriavidus sp. 30B13]|uniref:DUF5818 domain-containing protein n=1 Tax=Cupriavidus sp. 30B13 TaxID=3384241 RepID=UPI003B8F59F5